MDPGADPNPRIRTCGIQKIWVGSGIWIKLTTSRIQNQGVKMARDPGSGSATMLIHAKILLSRLYVQVQIHVPSQQTLVQCSGFGILFAFHPGSPVKQQSKKKIIVLPFFVAINFEILKII